MKKKLEISKYNSEGLDKYASQTRIRAVLWFIVILIGVGLGLVWWFYGRAAAFFGFLCLLGMLLPIGLIAVALMGLDVFVKKTDRDN